MRNDANDSRLLSGNVIRNLHVWFRVDIQTILDDGNFDRVRPMCKVEEKRQKEENQNRVHFVHAKKEMLSA